MTRDELEFSIHYSRRLEAMSATLLGRIDRSISLVQFCLGASAFASVASVQAVGCIIVLLSAVAMVYQPGVKAGSAEVQKRQYASLAAKMASLSDEALADEFAKIQESDSAEVGTLCNVAYNGELIRMGLPPAHSLTSRGALKTCSSM